MGPTFGARLRLLREQQAIALQTIADTTKITRSLLEGLERDDISRWPAGVYRRSYVRAYAHAIGLDPDAAVQEFLQQHPEPEDDPRDTLERIVDAQANRRPPTRFESLITSAIGVVPRLARHDSAPSAASNATAVRPTSPLTAAAPRPVDVTALADLCTRMACVRDSAGLEPLLAGARDVLRAEGLVVWGWNHSTASLIPAFASGYADAVVRRLPHLRRDADNAIAASFRTSDTRIVAGAADRTGAIVVPLQTLAGCTGVLAFELRDRREQDTSVRALATILAAQLATLVVPGVIERRSGRDRRAVPRGADRRVA